jgi:hypothetical protein
LQAVNPVSVERYPGPPNRNDHQQLAARANHTCQLSGSPMITNAIDRITVPSQANVFDNMHTREAFDTLIVER